MNKIQGSEYVRKEAWHSDGVHMPGQGVLRTDIQINGQPVALHLGIYQTLMVPRLQITQVVPA